MRSTSAPCGLSLALLFAACAAPPPVDDGGSQPDSGSETPDARPPRDSGANPGADAGEPGECFAARRLWFEDFEAGGYERWTSRTYDSDWGDGCQSNGFSTEHAVSGASSHRSEIVCAIGESHRGYGGIQFEGDSPAAAYTNRGEGIVAPHGVVNTFWSRVETPYTFEDGRWLSLFTVNGSCDWSERVITLGLENDSWRLTPAHVANTGGTVTFAPGAPAFPRGEWVRVTIYLNWASGQMHVWQNGRSVLHARFSRPGPDMCQFHWGAYASGNNDDVVLYEDDNAIWRLEAPWTDFEREPWFDGGVPACE